MGMQGMRPWQVGLLVAAGVVAAVLGVWLVRWVAERTRSARSADFFNTTAVEDVSVDDPHAPPENARFVVNNGQPTTYGGGRCRITLAPATAWIRGRDVDVDVSFGSGCYSRLKNGTYTFFWNGDSWKTQEHQNAYMRMFFETKNGHLISTLDSKYRSPWTFRTVHEYRRVREGVRYESGGL